MDSSNSSSISTANSTGSAGIGIGTSASTGTTNTVTIINPNDPYNVFRHSFLRYAGYANEVGESFRYQYPRFVGPSYFIAFGYCCADAATTGYSAYYSTSTPILNLPSSFDITVTGNGTNDKNAIIQHIDTDPS
jgi:hypothetical protein